ncbi:hypothetical protein PHJA_000193500 [Phtheirospermum japonicum]|uniref:Uncharacterized protein n=1 Tax=Phtheirospermum japonicum TaxID=374723 RepID=A0A830BEK3_9LAMI|nr:hypothetical protein PHJA_000193500 [Phtheirospermum japonicum]
MGNCIGAKFKGDKEMKDEKVYEGLLHQLMKQQSLQPPLESCSGHKVKIVVTKKQLQLLMRKAETRRKWRPSLATIPEL